MEDEKLQEAKDFDTVEKYSKWSDEYGRYMNKIRSPFAPQNVEADKAKKRLAQAAEEGRFAAPGFGDQGKFLKRGGKVSTAKVGKRIKGFD